MICRAIRFITKWPCWLLKYSFCIPAAFFSRTGSQLNSFVHANK